MVRGIAPAPAYPKASDRTTCATRSSRSTRIETWSNCCAGSTPPTTPGGSGSCRAGHRTRWSPNALPSDESSAVPSLPVRPGHRISLRPASSSKMPRTSHNQTFAGTGGVVGDDGDGAFGQTDPAGDAAGGRRCAGTPGGAAGCPPCAHHFGRQPSHPDHAHCSDEPNRAAFAGYEARYHARSSGQSECASSASLPYRHASTQKVPCMGTARKRSLISANRASGSMPAQASGWSHRAMACSASTPHGLL